MKKVLILILTLFIITGCVNINDCNYEKIINETTTSKYRVYNTYRKGYKFYLPVGLYVEDSKDYNEVIKSDKETFYLYIDLINYLNKTGVTYQEDAEVYFQYEINNNDLTGYVKAKVLTNSKYLVEIVYNYAKIEVIVEKSRLKESVSDALIILSSIKYNDTFLNSLSNESLLNYKEETVDIFDKVGGNSTSNFLEWIEEYDSSDGYDNSPPDLDLIN